MKSLTRSTPYGSKHWRHLTTTYRGCQHLSFGRQTFVFGPFFTISCSEFYELWHRLGTVHESRPVVSLRAARWDGLDIVVCIIPMLRLLAKSPVSCGYWRCVLRFGCAEPCPFPGQEIRRHAVVRVCLRGVQPRARVARSGRRQAGMSGVRIAADDPSDERVCAPNVAGRGTGDAVRSAVVLPDARRLRDELRCRARPTANRNRS